MSTPSRPLVTPIDLAALREAFRLSQQQVAEILGFIEPP